MKKKTPFLVLFLLLAIAAALGIYRHLSEKTKFNETYVNGNVAGNLYNSGLFCENDGTIFFSNPADENKLYSMNSDGSNVKKLCDDTALSINADANYVYYVRNNQMKDPDTAFSFLNINTNSLCRIRRTGGDSVKILDSSRCSDASLIGNYLYYLRSDKNNSTVLSKIRIDGEDAAIVSTEAFLPCDSDGQYFYYNGLTGDHNIWKLDTASDSASSFYSGNCFMPTVTEDGIAYFMDCDNNYALARVDLSTGEKLILCEDRLDTYNLCGDYIYFARSGDNPALCRIRTDGSDYEVLADGVYNSINVTSSYVYVKEFYTEAIYRAPLNTPDALEIFAPTAE